MKRFQRFRFNPGDRWRASRADSLSMDLERIEARAQIFLSPRGNVFSHAIVASARFVFASTVERA